MTSHDPKARPGSVPVMVTPETARVQQGGDEIKLDSSHSGGSIFIFEHDIPTHYLGTPHTHAYEDQTAYILKGEIGFRVGDQEFLATAGSVVYKPRGLPHVTFNRTGEVARMLEITTPGKLLDYFDAVDSSKAAGTFGDNKDELDALRAQYGLTFHYEWIDELEEKYGVKWPNRPF